MLDDNLTRPAGLSRWRRDAGRCQDGLIADTIGGVSIPVVTFTDERLSNGLRLIIAEDHLAPVVAVNVWYGVGSKHEVPGKTGFAHLFEHVMFQGSGTSARPSTSPSSRPPAGR